MNDPDAFLTTQWTQVLSSKGEDESAREALRALADRYYAPVVAFLERDGHRDADSARDLAHGFFEWLLDGDRFNRLDRDRGRFRSYLLGALKHYLANERERLGRQKRGGDIDHVAMRDATDTSPAVDPADEFALAPDREFDRQWGLHIIAEAMEALHEEWRRAGKVDRFQALQPFLLGEGAHGGLAALAETSGMNEGAIRAQLHRLRSAFRRHVKAQIAPTLDTQNASELAGEMSVLFAALGGD